MAAKLAVEINKPIDKRFLKEGIQQVKEKLGPTVKKTRRGKLQHSQYIGSVDRQPIGEEDMLLWVVRGDLEGETFSEMIVAKDQTLQNKYHGTKILQTETESKCRLQTI